MIKCQKSKKSEKSGPKFPGFIKSPATIGHIFHYPKNTIYLRLNQKSGSRARFMGHVFTPNKILSQTVGTKPHILP